MTLNASNTLFNQLDINGDGVLSQNEFGTWSDAPVLGAGYVGSGLNTSYVSGGYGSGAYGSAGYGSAGYGSGAYGSAGYGSGVYGGDVYDSGVYGVNSGSVYSSSANALGNQAYNTSLVSSQGALQTYATDAQGLYLDSNPQIIRRAAASGPAVYTQNIRVRFLQPPPVPPHGPLIIKEVRPPQPPAPLPLRIRQQAPPRPIPPPLVLREHPPPRPNVIAGQTVIRRLAALPVPPRSVIIERLPPLPARPRDVIMERWVPYAAQAKRRTILQRAGPAQQYARPRNVIIQYEPVGVRVVRQFQRLGVSQASPQAYVQQYGGSLLDAGTLVQHARSAGVVEDISPPAIGYGVATYGQDLGSFSTSAAYANNNAYVVDGGLGYNGGVVGGLGYNGGVVGGLGLNGGVVGGLGYNGGLVGGLGYNGGVVGGLGYNGGVVGGLGWNNELAYDDGYAGGLSGYESSSWSSSNTGLYGGDLAYDGVGEYAY